MTNNTTNTVSSPLQKQDQTASYHQQHIGKRISASVTCVGIGLLAFLNDTRALAACNRACDGAREQHRPRLQDVSPEKVANGNRY